MVFATQNTHFYDFQDIFLQKIRFSLCRFEVLS